MRIVGLLPTRWLNLNFWRPWFNIFFTCCFSFPFKIWQFVRFPSLAFDVFCFDYGSSMILFSIILRPKSFLQICLLLEYLPLIYISTGTILMIQAKHNWNMFVYIFLGRFWKTIYFNKLRTYVFITLKLSQIYPLFSFQYDFYCLKHNNAAIKKNRFW